jgi:hypothetical protein
LLPLCAIAIAGNAGNSEQNSIGWLKWEISEDASGKVLASGEGRVQLEDAFIEQRSNTEKLLFDKRIPLTKEFPTASPAEKTGFGITGNRTDITNSFSWEWFNVLGAGDLSVQLAPGAGREFRAVKLQEGGELGIVINEINGAWEVTWTKFLTDISLRIKRMNVDQPSGPPSWRIKIFKGSIIAWPSLVNEKVTPN